VGDLGTLARQNVVDGGAWLFRGVAARSHPADSRRARVPRLADRRGVAEVAAIEHIEGVATLRSQGATCALGGTGAKFFATCAHKCRITRWIAAHTSRSRRSPPAKLVAAVAGDARKLHPRGAELALWGEARAAVTDATAATQARIGLTRAEADRADDRATDPRGPRCARSPQEQWDGAALRDLLIAAAAPNRPSCALARPETAAGGDRLRRRAARRDRAASRYAAAVSDMG